MVAALGRALDGVQRGQPVAQALDLRVDGGVVDGRLAAPDLEALVLPELGRGPHADLDREGQRLALARHVVREVDVGLADRGDAGGVDGVDVPLAQRGAQRLVEHGLAAEAAHDDGRRHLALAKARDAQLPAELAGRLLELALDLLGGNLGVDAHARLGELGDVRLDGGHGRADDSLTVWSWRIAARLVTGPVAFLLGGVIDVLAYAAASARARCRAGGRG